MRIVSIPFTTYKVLGILIYWTDNDASLIKPITLTLGFFPKGETLIPSFASTFNWSFYARSLKIVNTDASVSNNTDRNMPFNLI